VERRYLRLAGILLVVFPTVVFGGVSILSRLISDPAYAANALRQDLWRAGHAHAGVLLILSLVLLRYAHLLRLPSGLHWLAVHAGPIAAILLPLGMFLSVLTPDATEPNAMIWFAFAGGTLLFAGLLTFGVGLLRNPSNAAAEDRTASVSP